MARILCVWEQGANLGHLTNLRLLMEVALQAGHQVTLAARQLHDIPLVLGDLPITCVLAPFKQDAWAGTEGDFLSYTHLLRHHCFSSAEELQTYLEAWSALFAQVQPALVVFEHSPTALIAAHGQAFKKLVVGSGFMVPPDPADAADPFCAFPTTPRTAPVLAQLHADDAQLLQLINNALRAVHAEPLVRLQCIYEQADAHLLTTWAQTDHFGSRRDACYIGVLPPPRQALPEWPSGPGAKVFGYLARMPGLEALLHSLQEADVCSLLLVRDLPDDLRQRYASERMRFIDRPVDFNAVVEQAAWLLSHGNHGVVTHGARHGLPQLLIPRHQEQLFLTLRLLQQGAAAMAYQDQPTYGNAIAAMRHAALCQQAQHLAAAMTPSAALRAPQQIASTLQRLLSG